MELWKLFRDHLGATFYRRPYYRMMKEIIGEHRSARHRRLYALDCVLFLYMHRLLWIAYVIHTDFAPIRSGDIDSTLRNDAMLALAYSNRTYDSFCFIAIYLLCAFFWFCETSFWRLNPQSIIWRWWYQTVVLAQDAYRAAKLPSEVIARRRRQLENRYMGSSTCRRMLGQSVYGSITARVRMWWTISNVDQQRMFAKKPPIDLLPNLTYRARFSSILFFVIIDYLAFGFQILIASAFSAIAIVLAFSQNIKFYTQFGLIRIFAEIYALHYIVQRLVRSGIFCTYCSLIANFIYGRKSVKFFDLVRSCIWRHRREKHAQKCSISNEKILDMSLMRVRWGNWVHDGTKMRIPLSLPKQCGPTIKMVLIEHNQSTDLLLRASEELFANILFAYLLTNLPINVYILQRLAFEPLSPLDSIINSIVFSLQFAAAIVVFWPMAMASATAHLPTRFIPALQACIRSTRWLPFKLKYDDLFGRLIWGPKMGISIGPMEAVTYKCAFESVLLYGAFFLMSFRRKSSDDHRSA